MHQFQNYILGNWENGQGVETTIYHAITGKTLGSVSSDGIDFSEVLNYGRNVGGPILRKMTFQERGRMLKALALFLMDQKERYYEVSAWTGATKIDSWIDIEGGIGNLFANASLRKQFPDLTEQQPRYQKTEVLLVTILWCRKKVLPYILMRLIFRFGEC